MFAALALIFQERVDLAGKQRQFAARQIERVAARGRQERPVVRDDQAGLVVSLKKVLQQNLRAQVEKVRRLVQEQQIRLVQQQLGQLHASLPAAGEVGDRSGEPIALDFEFARHFAAFPLGLAAVALQEFPGRFTGKKRIVLPQITQLQLRMTNDFALIELFLPQQNP